jgi:hypothetical protein
MEGTEYTLPESGIKGVISNGMQMFMQHDPKANVYHPNFEISHSICAKFGGDTDASLRLCARIDRPGRDLKFSSLAICSPWQVAGLRG